MTESRVLSSFEQQSALTLLPDWSVKGTTLIASFVFSDFEKAFAFMTQVARVAEKLQHHPEWTNVYNKVTCILKTHDSGDVITDKDIELATEMSRIAKEIRQ